MNGWLILIRLMGGKGRMKGPINLANWKEADRDEEFKLGEGCSFRSFTI
jgi:hypothetical protein